MHAVTAEEVIHHAVGTNEHAHILFCTLVCVMEVCQVFGRLC